MQDPEIRAKQVESTRGSCGVAHALQSPEVRERVKQTCLATYGVPNPAQSEACKEKARQTSFVNNGFAHALQSPEILEKRNLTLRARYDRKAASQFHIPRQVLDLFDNPEWLKNQHLIEKKSLLALAQEYKVSESFVGTRMRQFGIPTQRFFSSIGEGAIGTFIESLGLNIERGNRQLLKPQELDIWIPSKNLAIEYCGLYWHSSAFKYPTYHKAKLDQCQAQGIRLLTIFEDEWLHRRSIVEAKLKSILGCSDTPTVGARKCQIVQVSTRTKKAFLEQNHIQGDGPGSITYGLEHQGQLVACMTFIEEQGGRFNLNRYAASCRIPGGFSKLMKHFQQHHQWNQIKSFADLRWSTGDLYSQSGFLLDGLVAPDYQYVVGANRVHKFNFRHSSGLRHLPNYDPSKTESQLMDEAGIHKIYNCGLQRWVIRNPENPKRY
jgi:hypothetical protein